MQIHTYRFTGHSPADPEHERGRKQEKQWARQEADPITLFEEYAIANKIATQEELDERRAAAQNTVKEAVKFADASPMPPAELAKELEYPDKPDTDYNLRDVPAEFAAITKKIMDPEALKGVEEYIESLRALATAGSITIGDAVNLAILEEMLRDPTTTIHAEDLQAGSSYNIPKLTQQTFGNLRAADEIIDEGHFVGKVRGDTTILI